MYDILTIGTATRDVFLTSALFRTVHDPAHLEKLGFVTGEAQCVALGGKVEIEAPTLTIGGGAANAATTFARQGLKTAALISLGKDDNGIAVADALKREGIDPLIHFDSKHMTAYSTILLSSTGERTILVYRGASERLSISPKIKKDMVARAAYIAPGGIPVSVISSAMRDLKKQGAYIGINPSKKYLELGLKKLGAMLGFADVVIMNREEASSLTGVNYEDIRGIFAKLDEAIEGIAIMTDGATGVWVSDGRGIFRAGTYKEKKLVDRTGSGDAFGSGFFSELLRSGSRPGAASREVIEDAIRFGSANATSVVEHIGAQEGIVRPEDFKSDARWRNLVINYES